MSRNKINSIYKRFQINEKVYTSYQKSPKMVHTLYLYANLLFTVSAIHVLFVFLISERASKEDSCLYCPDPCVLCTLEDVIIHLFLLTWYSQGLIRIANTKLISSITTLKNRRKKVLKLNFFYKTEEWRVKEGGRRMFDDG